MKTEKSPLKSIQNKEKNWKHDTEVKTINSLKKIVKN